MTKTKAATGEASTTLAEFDRRLQELARFAPVTIALVALNVVLWIATVTYGVDWLDPSGDSLIAWGANYGPLTSHGEGWRLLSCCFLHAGIVHLLVNQWALWQFGNWLERLFGHVGFALLYVIGGFASSVIAVRWQPDTVLTGSTGAVAALIGALAAFCLRVPGVAPGQALSRLRASTFVFLGYNVGVGLYRQRLDAAGFIGGLVVGFLCGLVLAQPLAAERPPRRLSRNALLGIAGIVLAVFVPSFVQPNPTIEFNDIRRAELAVLADFQAAVDRLHGDQRDVEEFVQVMGTKVLSPWRHLENRVDELDRRNLSGDAGKWIRQTLESMKLREQGWNLLVDSILAGSEEGGQDAFNKIAEAKAIEDELDAEAKAKDIETTQRE